MQKRTQELLALAHSIRVACEERLSCLEEEELTEDVKDQIGHWLVLWKQADDVIGEARRTR